MMMLLLQTFLLLLAAYLFGAMLACGMRRAIAARPSDEQAAWRQSQMEPDAIRAAVATSGGLAGEQRFGRTLSGDDELASASVTSPPVVEVQPIPAAPPTPPAPEVSRAPSAATVAAASAAAAAAAQAISKPKPAPEPKPAPAPATPEPAPAPAAPVSTGPVDDLTLIRAIDAGTADRLTASGVTSYAQIAGWTAADVNRMSQALGFTGRIEKENWIEQAQVLAKGGLTDYARSLKDGEKPKPASTPTTPEAATAAAAAATAAAGASAPARPVNLAEAIRTQEAQKAPPPAEPATTASESAKSDVASLRSVRSEALRSEAVTAIEATSHDDLKRIRGVGVLIEKKLNALGVMSYEQVANWTGADVEHYSQYVEPHGRIERENWIEQARILASGGQTDYARRFDRGEVDAGG